jgi:hypothetical protein
MNGSVSIDSTDFLAYVVRDYKLIRHKPKNPKRYITKPIKQNRDIQDLRGHFIWNTRWNVCLSTLKH